MRVAPQIALNDEQKSKLTIYARGRSVPKRMVERAKIVLQAAEGKPDERSPQFSTSDVTRWRDGGRGS